MKVVVDTCIWSLALRQKIVPICLMLVINDHLEEISVQ